jgi:hypothetical protein
VVVVGGIVVDVVVVVGGIVVDVVVVGGIVVDVVVVGGTVDVVVVRGTVVVVRGTVVVVRGTVVVVRGTVVVVRGTVVVVRGTVVVVRGTVVVVRGTVVVLRGMVVVVFVAHGRPWSSPRRGLLSWPWSSPRPWSSSRLQRSSTVVALGLSRPSAASAKSGSVTIAPNVTPTVTANALRRLGCITVLLGRPSGRLAALATPGSSCWRDLEGANVDTTLGVQVTTSNCCMTISSSCCAAAAIHVSTQVSIPTCGESLEVPGWAPKTPQARNPAASGLARVVSRDDE